MNDLGLTEIIVTGFILLLPILFWIWCIRDISIGEFQKPNQKGIWLAVVILFPLIGSIIYLIAGRGYRLPTRYS